jgi:CrcB protein
VGPREYLWVAVGGTAGAVARHAVVLAVRHRFGGAVEFPWGTLLVNVSGSFAIGLIASLLLARNADPAWRLLLVTGFLGGYTTFSAFSLEIVSLLQAHRLLQAGLYAAGSAVLGVASCGAGIWLSRIITR